MRKINTLRNPRLITFFLLFLTFGLAIIAVVTAINLQKKDNVNPTPGQAACQYPNACSDAVNQCAGAAACEANAACQADATCAANCRNQRNDCTINTQRCTECNGTVNTPAPTSSDTCSDVDSRYNQLISQGWPACYAGNRARFENGGDCLPPDPRRAGNQSDCDGDGDRDFDDVNWPGATNPTATNTPVPTNNNTCAAGQVRNNRTGQCVSACNGSGNEGMGACHCGGNVCYNLENPICNPSNANECIPAPNRTDWPKFKGGVPSTAADAIQSEARIPVSTLNNACPDADFRTSCNPVQGYMCGVSSTLGNTILGRATYDGVEYQYYNSFSNRAASTSSSLAVACGVSCTPGLQGNASVCNNPYWCPGNTPTPTPGNGITTTPTPTRPGNTATPTPALGSVSVDTFCGDGPVGSRSFNMRIDIDGQTPTYSGTVAIGQTKSLSGISFANGGVKVNVAASNIPSGLTVKANTCSNGSGGTFQNGGSCYIEFAGCRETTITSTPTPTPSQGLFCESLASNQTTYKVGDTPTFTASTRGINRTSGYSYKIRLENTNGGTNAYATERVITCAANGACAGSLGPVPPLHMLTGTNFKAAVILNGVEQTNCRLLFSLTPRTPVCTGLTVTPSTNIKQGDTLAVRVNSSDATGLQYRLDSNFGYASGATGTYQTSPNFSVPIPTDRQLSGITMTGTVFRDGQSSSQGCNFSYTFTPNTTIEKDILPNGATGSTGLAGTAPHYIVEPNDIVKYSVKVKNSGQNVMQNLIVVDTLSAYDPATGAAINTPFGDIQSATNLDRTTGTRSTPQTVGPRVPSGNGPYAAGVKSVEWTKINSLFPTEEYTGTLDVKILAFSGTPVLKNTVCLYQDTNNNGQYDQGVDRELDCDHELVYTAQPQFTVVKSAIEETGTTPVGVLEPGKKFKYQITLTNTAATDLNLEGVTITDTFDSAFLSKFNITNISDAGVRNNNIITWSDLTGTVAPNGTKVVSFIAEVKSDFFTGNENCSEVVKNNVMAVNTAPGYSTPQYEIRVTVLNRQCRTEFEIVKTVNPSTVAPGATVTYTVQITNRGTKSAPIVKIVDDYADEFTYQNGSTVFVKPDNSTFSKNPTIANGSMTWEFAESEQVTLAPSQSLTFTYKMTAGQNAGFYPNTICLENPSGGCDDAVVTIQTQPNTGIGSTGITRIIGFGFMAASIVLWFIINNRKSLNYNANIRGRGKRASYVDKVDNVARKLRNR
jgi:fimbrial isopeptide formation D2 family protein